MSKTRETLKRRRDDSAGGDSEVDDPLNLTPPQCPSSILANHDGRNGVSRKCVICYGSEPQEAVAYWCEKTYIENAGTLNKVSPCLIVKANHHPTEIKLGCHGSLKGANAKAQANARKPQQEAIKVVDVSVPGSVNNNVNISYTMSVEPPSSAVPGRERPIIPSGDKSIRPSSAPSHASIVALKMLPTTNMPCMPPSRPIQNTVITQTLVPYLLMPSSVVPTVMMRSGIQVVPSACRTQQSSGMTRDTAALPSVSRLDDAAFRNPLVVVVPPSEPTRKPSCPPF